MGDDHDGDNDGEGQSTNGMQFKGLVAESFGWMVGGWMVLYWCCISILCKDPFSSPPLHPMRNKYEEWTESEWNKFVIREYANNKPLSMHLNIYLLWLSFTLIIPKRALGHSHGSHSPTPTMSGLYCDCLVRGTSGVWAECNDILEDHHLDILGLILGN